MRKADVLEFKFNLEDNLFQLHKELKDKTYQHSHYTAFSVCDPKLRRIHKACVRDRVLHHAVFRILYPIFDKSFIFDSYSCRIGKGTHRAVARLGKFCHKLSEEHLKKLILPIGNFLKNNLGLDLHPDKIIIRKYRQGVDFLGYVVLPHYIALRTKTKQRMLRKIKEKKFLLREDLIPEESFNQSLQSYLGMLKHCRGYKIKKDILSVSTG